MDTSAGEEKYISLKMHGISPERGMLPYPDPDRQKLPPAFFIWEEMARQIPKLLLSRHMRLFIETVPTLDAALLQECHLPAAMRALSFMGHAYVWADLYQPANRIPASVAIPWYGVAERLGRPPVLSYASYASDNWRRLDPYGPIALGNIALIQNFMGGIDEEWFILVHVEIEAKAAAVMKGIVDAFAAMARDDISEIDRGLQTIAGGIEQMFTTLCRMPEWCDPYIYYHRVRPYLHGWKNNPALPDGVVYEGVRKYGGQPQQFRGETGAQSGIIPALDAALGIVHRDDPLRTYLMEMRDYMPPRHRIFIEGIERGPSLRAYVENHRSLVDGYNACVMLLDLFRSKHLKYAWEYVGKWNKKSKPANPAHVGTGGTPFMPYLQKHREETNKHLLDTNRVSE